ncbi:hypothetical protein WMY93_025924 [Mugilogobius chulae]|uniref:C3H1-type domain-containing protein n=1 Tax=Mugilogobius chulae TaxID=88201 RepID=A0AAW0N5X0_9GOBI
MASQETGGNDAHQSDPIPGQSVPTEAQNTSELNDTSVEPEHHGQNQVSLCQFFMIGKCRFGQKCRLSHSEPVLDDSEAASANKTDEENEEKKINKKPRMRTADDVINRILWDSSVDSAQFVVGYVDRFLGVLERPFCEFNWETNPCDCDYTSELALPRHRIQYFTFRGQRVWDRHSRTDRVFGSTGQALAPPFGGEGEVEEDVKGAAPNEEALPGVGGQEPAGAESCTTNAHLEDESQTEMNINTSESAAQSKQSAQEQAGLQETCAANRVQTSSVTVEMDETMNDEEENHKDLSTCVESLDVDDDEPAQLAQKEEKQSGRPPKKRPTHFITFRANTPAILSCFTQLQEELTAALPASAPHWSTAASLHVTLCLLVLPGPEEVEAAAEVLRRFARWDRNPPVALTFPLKLKHFNGRVLYVSPQPHLHLQQLNSWLQEEYRNLGLLHRESYNPRYHLTLAKVNDKQAERIFEGVGSIKVGKSLSFGRLPINTLHLCAMGGCKEDGFYEILCTVTLR